MTPSRFSSARAPGRTPTSGATPTAGITAFWTPHNRGANYGYLDGHVKWNLPEQTVNPNWLWIQYNPGDACGGGTGGWSQCQRRNATAALAVYRQKVPD
ncbi:MAG: hypothetical protein COZ06_00020 [Armatimonadetes bacterium CG_4_10_14_3_um_filter_66_18]|nr:hypothetical protein [Armatimonadota bacterium]PIY54452.1 MAG: hypothetical protein COZ06_00020 [Armatimonadetes bacterium CG_4_10_14_3_um_filter_66_18]PIZ45082.1 MAG: hypothetical protein COY42_12885 [Armatimonadetes bacterium CG_4_10_14_0_8_um_filter_66_14]NCO96146.1 hypothetical protein [Armatimonadota bacterium]NCQ27649.1 hypothetical protein [Armatimonadota bacterium]